MVDVALGHADASSACPAGDPDGAISFKVDDILRAVNNAVLGCP